MTSQCAFGQLPVVPSRPDGRTEWERTDRQCQNTIPPRNLPDG